jgi:acylphosphatase
MAIVHCSVHGRVQGVGFRHFVVHEALALGLTGWVRNQPDGSVEALAEGPAAGLHGFVSALQRGPVRARVDRVVTEWREGSPSHRSFRIE